jgi:hypothetical protein
VINADTQTQLEIKLWPLLSLGWPQPEFHFMGLTVSLYGVTISTYGVNHSRRRRRRRCALTFKVKVSLG